MTISSTHIERADIRFAPAPDVLKPFTGCFWTVTAEAGAAIRVVPDGTATLAIELPHGGPDEGPVWRLRGPLGRPSERRFARAATQVGVRLRPGVAYLVTGIPAHALVDRSIDLRFAGEPPAAPAQCVDLLQRFLVERLRGAHVHPVVSAALRGIADSSGGISIGTLADRCGVSARHLHRLMRVWVGCGPKRYATIVRFQSTLAQMEQAPVQPAAALASDAGYFDQAHLTSDVGRFAGATPGRLRTDAVSDFSKTRCADLP
jgi:AraC-like DNA-binding protein